MKLGVSSTLGLGGLFVPQKVLDGLPILLQTVISQPVILGGVAIVFLYPILCGQKQSVVA